MSGSGSLDSAKIPTAVVVGGTYNVVSPAPADGQSLALQQDANGNLLVNVAVGGGSGGTVKIEDTSGNALNSNGTGALNVAVVSGGGSNASVGTTGAAAPTSATEIGIIDGSGHLTGVSSTTPVPVSATSAANASGNPIFTESVSGSTTAVTQATAASLKSQSIILDGAGTNLGTVKAASTAATASDTALVVTEPGSTTAGACSNTSVTSSSSAILAANVARREAVIVNTDVVTIYIGLGQTPSGTAYHVALKPCTVAHDGTGGSFVTDVWKGAINAIVASTSGHCAVTEMT